VRILLVTKAHLPVLGGGQMTVHWLALALAGRGHSVSVLSVAPQAAEEADLGYPLIRVADPPGVTPALVGELAPDVAVLNGFHGTLVEWGDRLLRALRPVPTAL